jgi:hypothetical protein
VRGAATRFTEIKNGKLLEVESAKPFFEMIENPMKSSKNLKNKNKDKTKPAMLT